MRYGTAVGDRKAILCKKIKSRFKVDLVAKVGFMTISIAQRFVPFFKNDLNEEVPSSLLGWTNLEYELF